jgi:sialidase-1
MPNAMPKQNSKLELLDSGVIYRNPNPGYQYTFACHSHIVQLSPQELLCTYQRGQARDSVDCVMAQARSTDGGKTWTDEGLLRNPKRDKAPYSYHGPVLTRLDGSALVVTAIRIDRSDPDKPLYNEKTGGVLPSDTILLHSKDNGKTWSTPRVLSFPEGLLLTPSCPIVVLKDGVWFLSTDQWHAFDDPGPYRPRTVGLFSTDRGRTWNTPVTFADGSKAGKGHWHGRIIRLRDDRLFTLLWTAKTNGGGDLPLHACYGSADGREWSEPQPTNIPGQTNWPVDLGDGRMVDIYTVRETKPPGFFVTVSKDGGRTWDLDRQLLIWDATGRDKIGVHAPQSYPRSHDTIAYGAPTATVLHNGEILVSFWCTEMSVTQIRYARLRLT